MSTHATTWFGVLYSGETAISAGMAVVTNGTTYLPATTANRATYGRSVGVAITAASTSSPSFEYQVAGLLPNSLSGLGAGSVSWVRVSATGYLERCTPASGDDIVGKCLATGDVVITPGVWDSNNYTGSATSMSGYFDVRDYGAVADWGCGRTGNTSAGTPTITGVNFTTGLTAGQKVAIQGVTGSYTIQSLTSSTITVTTNIPTTVTGGWVVVDNLDAFNSALDAIRNDATYGNKAARLVVDGPFYLSGTLNLYVSVLLEGSGAVYYSATYGTVTAGSSAGTLLVFPKDTTGIFVHSGTSLDSPTKFADHAVIRDLNLACYDATTTSGNGIEIRNRAFVHRVTIQSFGGDGVHIEADAVAGTGNASASYLETVTVGSCGGHGFLLSGADVNICTVISCDALGNTGYGFKDASFGNTYIGCHAEFNKGDVGATVDLPGYSTGGGGSGDTKYHDYYTESASNCCVFVGCYSESGTNYVQTPGIIIGGLGMSDHGSNRVDLGATALGGQGVVTGRPLRFQNNREGATGYQAIIGADVDDSNVLRFSTLDTNKAIVDQSYIKFVDDSWYVAHGPSQIQQMWPMSAASPREWTTYFPNGIMYGYVTEACRWHYAATTPPTNQRDGATPHSYLSGDIIWNTDTTAPRMGWICTTAGTISGGTAVFADLPPRSGLGTQAMADANQTPTESVYGFVAIKTTGALTANRDLVLPTLTDNQAREWTIINACTGGFSVVVKCAAGTTVTIANGKTAKVWVDSGGVTRVTADV